MKRTTTIVLFASIFAVAIGGLGYSSNFATPLLVTAAPQSQEMVGILGHVEYKVLDDFGNIKSYMQNDNIVVQDGTICSAKAIFGSTASVAGCKAGATTDYTYIGIGNGTISGAGTHLGITNRTLADSSDDGDGECSRQTIQEHLAVVKWLEEM